MITFGSVCSGIEAASMAWEPLGFKPSWFSEVEKFPSAVLNYRWPLVANMGDMCSLPEMVRVGLVDTPDVLVGGTPCQAFSVAGLRKGLEDDRGQLTIKYVELADEIDKKRIGDESIIVWENVPGVLSSKDNAFGCFLGALAGEECELQPPGKKWEHAGYVHGPTRSIAWRTLDAQYFGVAQRRRRVFLVASARDRFDPRSVLFESEGLRRDIAPSRETGKEATGDTPKSIGECSDMIQTHRMVAFGEYKNDETASTMKSRDYKDATDLVVHGTQDPCVQNGLSFPLSRNSGQENVIAIVGNIIDRQPHSGGNGLGADTSGVMYILTSTDKHAVAHTLRGVGFDASEDGTGRGTPLVPVGFSGKDYGGDACNNLCPTLRAGGANKSHANSGNWPAISYGMKVRRLTPRECERLQGFPDDHTLIPWRKKTTRDCPDGPRYKAIGNSMAVPVMRWIGERIIKELQK